TAGPARVAQEAADVAVHLAVGGPEDPSACRVPRTSQSRGALAPRPSEDAPGATRRCLPVARRVSAPPPGGHSPRRRHTARAELSGVLARSRPAPCATIRRWFACQATRPSARARRATAYRRVRRDRPVPC